MRTRWWLVLVALVVSALVSPGNFGSVDTVRRLQVARSIRLGEPEVTDVEFGITGKDGRRHAWFGLGQSLVLVPFDAAVSATISPFLVRAKLNAEKQEQVRDLLIAFLMQFVITSLILILADQILRSYGFTPLASAAGTLALLFGTTCLQYVQSAQENNLLLMLDLGALWAIRRWQRDGGFWAVVAGACCGFAILTRLPSVLETLIFAVLAVGDQGLWRRFLSGYVPPVITAIAVDRWYHWIRFHELFSTYISIWGRQFAPRGAPASFPFSYPFWKGFWGTFLSPDKSVILFDPLLLVVAALAIWRWRKLERDLRVTLLWLFALLFGYAAGYARYYDFGGDAAWGHRFVVVPVQLLALFSVPLLLAHGKAARPSWKAGAWVLVAVSVVFQWVSTTIAPPVEIVQIKRGYAHGVLWNRAVNLIELASGREEPARFKDVPAEWQTLYFFPFQLRFRYPRLAVWAVAMWSGLLFCLALLVHRTLRAAQRDVTLH